MAIKLLPQNYRHKQKHMSKMTYSESEPDSNFVINSLSTFAPIFSESKSDQSESDFSSLFINLHICIFWSYIYIFLNKLAGDFLYQSSVYFNIIPNFIVFFPQFTIFNKKRHVFTPILKVFDVSTHLR